jgi:ketosteroid isomerase-like protein
MEGSAMGLDEQTVRRIFADLEHGDGDAFFSHVADDVDWTLMGTHPLAGHYTSKAAFKAGTFSKLGKVLPGGAQLQVTHAFVSGTVAVVELVSGATARTVCASTITIAGSLALTARRSSRFELTSIPHWLPSCSDRTRSEHLLSGGTLVA